MTIILSKGLCIWSAAFTIMLLALGLLITGCSSNRPSPRAFNAPALDAYALSGGKITHFIGNPELPADPTAKALLQACRSLSIKSHTAQSAYVIIHSRKGTQPVPALVVGGMTLVLMGSIERMLNGEVDHITASVLNLPGGTQRAKIGNKWVTLKFPIVAIDHGTQTVVTLPDLLTLFQICDVQHGGGHEIQYLEIRKGLNFIQVDEIWKN